MYHHKKNNKNKNNYHDHPRVGFSVKSHSETSVHSANITKIRLGGGVQKGPFVSFKLDFITKINVHIISRMSGILKSNPVPFIFFSGLFKF